MPPGQRRIFFSADCDEAAERLGGYERIDGTLDGVLDALQRNPYGFPHAETDWFSFRYAVTKPIAGVPALVWFFTIDKGDVVLQHVEVFEGY